MTIYNYVAIDKNGDTKKGIIDGESTQDIQHKLVKMNLTIVELTSNETKNTVSSTNKSSINAGTLALLTFQLGALLSAGISIASVLKNIAEQIEKPYLKTVLLTIQTRLLEGHSLASSMNEFPNVFPELYCATIASGEKTGHLDEVINKLAEHLEQQEQIKQRIKQALIYPALLLSISMIIIIYLLIYTIPTITKTLTDNGQTLPLATIFLLKICQGLKSYGIYFVLLLFMLFFWFKHLLRSNQFRYKLHLFFLKIPLLNNAITIINAARFSKTLGMLFAAGTPIIEAMQTANHVVTCLPIQAAITQSITDVIKGMSIHQALFQTGYFSKISIQLIASGETSNQLDVMLEKTAEYQDRQVSRWITTTLALLEPIIIVFMGLIILFIVLATLLPIFQLNDISAA